MLIPECWEEFRVGETLTTDGVTITETHIVEFTSLTLEFSPLHMDEEFAKSTPFGRRIANGPLLLSIAVGLVMMTGVLVKAGIAILGFDNVRFLAPTYIGDSIRVKVTIKEKRESKRPGRGVIVAAHEIINQRGETVMTFDQSQLIKRRES